MAENIYVCEFCNTEVPESEIMGEGICGTCNDTLIEEEAERLSNVVKGLRHVRDLLITKLSTPLEDLVTVPPDLSSWLHEQRVYDTYDFMSAFTFLIKSAEEEEKSHFYSTEVTTYVMLERPGSAPTFDPPF